MYSGKTKVLDYKWCTIISSEALAIKSATTTPVSANSQLR